MHAVFMLYGIKDKVDHLIMEMQCQKFNLKLTKEGEEDKAIVIQGHLRILPFGIYEFVFPREYKDVVLTTLDFGEKDPYSLNSEFKVMAIKINPLDLLKKFLRIEPIPEFKTDKKLIWIREHVAVLPFGVREDGDLTETQGPSIGWTHERI